MTSKVHSMLLLLLLIVGSSPALIYIPGIPVDQMTLYQLQAACNILEYNLDSNPTLPQSKAYKIYGDTYLANYFLQKLVADPGIASYNNVLVGNNISMSGNKNIIFGNQIALNGSQNYVFTQNFNSSAISQEAINNNLVLGNWAIKLLKLYTIPFGPSNAIDNWTY